VIDESMADSSLATIAETRTPRVRRDFKLYWLGNSISMTGSAVSTLAIPVMAVTLLHASAPQMSWLIASGTIPSLLSPLFAGPMIERLRKRRMLIGANCCGALCLGLIPILYFTSGIDFGVILAIALVVGAIAVLDNIGTMALIPEIVSDGYLMKANARLQASQSVAEVVGPGSGGGLVQLLGAPLTMLIDAASYLVSAVCLLLLRYRDEDPDPVPSGVRAYLSQVRDGIKCIADIKPLRLLAFSGGSYNFWAGATDVVIVLFVLRQLHVAPGIYGLSLAIGCLGGVAGAGIVAKSVSWMGTRRVMPLALMTASAGPLVLAAARVGGVLPAILVVVTLFLISFGATAYATVSITLRQKLVAPEVLGRSLASMRMITFGPIPLGALAGGALAAATSLRMTLVVAGLGQLLTGLALAKFRDMIGSDG
jgi:Major Facilitator Superfamily